MIVGFAELLLKLGIKPMEITILAAYSVQLESIRQMLGNVIIKSDTIDNYQGQENKVVLLSLVRSGSSGIGFLAIDNRVSVALSRARRGLLILGNLDQLCQHSEMWRKVRSILSEQNSILSQVDMKCDTHGNVTTIRERKDFDKSPLGGCNTICGLILNCGHPCIKMCHYLNQRHKCDNLCEKMCKNNYQCQKLCDVLCGLCVTPVEITLDWT